MNLRQQVFLEYRARPGKDSLLALLVACQDPVYNLCHQILRHRQDAEDAAQEVLLEVIGGANSLPDAPAFDRWLYRVATNTALDFRKKRARRRGQESRRATMNPPDPAPPGLMDAVHEALRDLDDDLRRLMVQHFLERRTLEALAAEEGCSTAAVWKRIEKGKERLRATLAGAGLAGILLALDGALQAVEPVAAPPGLLSGPILDKAGTAAQALPATGGKGLWIAVVVGASLLASLLATGLLRSRPVETISGGRPAQEARRGTLSAPAPPSESSPPIPADPAAPPAAQLPEASILVRVVDLSRGGYLPAFRITVAVSGGGFFLFTSRREEFEAPIILPEGIRQAAARVCLVDPRIEGGAVREILLTARETTEVNLVVRSGMEIAGFVTGPDGLPVVGALAFVGTQELGRGDEPFKPFRPERILDGGRTDAAGRFILRNYGAFVTVWHEEHSPLTVPVEESWRIALPPRGTLRGKITGQDGAPVRAAPVTLDRTRQATTDDEGRFEFTNVETGVRGLQLPGNRWIAVAVKPGQHVDAEIGSGLPEVAVDLGQAADGFGKGTRGVIIGLNGISSIHEVKRFAPSVHLQNVLPGRYLLLSSAGHIAQLDLSGAVSRADFGTATLQVTSTVERTVYVVPEPSHELVDVMVKRMATRKLAVGALAIYAPLPTGEYLIKAADGAVLGKASLGDQGARVDLGDR